MKIAIAQIDSTAGALKENAEKIFAHIKAAKEKGCSLVVFPEMALTGYPVSDLVYEKDFLQEARKRLEGIALHAKGIAALVGFIDFDTGRVSEDGSFRKFNSAAFLKDGKIAGIQAKSLLPTYDVFDEKRFFSPASSQQLFELQGKKFGVTICEDLWDKNYSIKPFDTLLEKGADFIVNLSASPFNVGKFSKRLALLKNHAKKGIPLVFANRVGVQDNGLDVLVFDGQSIALNAKSEIIALGKRFSEQLLVFELEDAALKEPSFSEEEDAFDALAFGLGEYAKKCGFSKAVLGLSGGIDSSVVACIAAKAFGKENVLGITMPSKFSSPGSVEDSRALAKNLGMQFKEWPVEQAVELNRKDFENAFGENLRGTAAENPQARLRGNMLMTVSNAQNRILLGTGNKTELALGYCTLYGDMAGGIEVIGDVSKAMVYRLAEFINRNMNRPIPKAVLEKAPSAELAPNQEDPFDYAKVSPLVDLIVEANKTKAELVEQGFPEALVVKMKNLVDSAQYKRKQAPPVIRVTGKAFGSGRVYPIINKWRW